MQQSSEPIVELRRYHIGDMADIERLCFSQPWSVTALADEVNNPLAVYRVCENSEGRVLGYIGTRIIHDECYITNVAVHPDHRRRGVASRLLASLTQWAKSKELSMMTLEVRVSNDAAIAFYEKSGFVPMGKRIKYYEKPPEDALLMTKMLENLEL